MNMSRLNTDILSPIPGAGDVLLNKFGLLKTCIPNRVFSFYRIVWHNVMLALQEFVTDKTGKQTEVEYRRSINMLITNLFTILFSIMENLKYLATFTGGSISIMHSESTTMEQPVYVLFGQSQQAMFTTNNSPFLIIGGSYE